MKLQKALVLSLILGVCLAASVGTSSPALADIYTFPFNWEVDNATPFPLINPGDYGFVTLSDSAIDPNRVDITWHIVPAPAWTGATLERLLLNIVPDNLTNHQLYLVAANAAAGSSTNLPGVTAIYSNDVQTTGNRTFDIRVNDGNDLTGSLALFNQLPNPDVPVNLDASMFNNLSGLTGAAAPGTVTLYALYRTHNFSTFGEFWAGSTLSVVPVPAALPLGILGLAGLTVLGRKMRKLA